MRLRTGLSKGMEFIELFSILIMEIWHLLCSFLRKVWVFLIDYWAIVLFYIILMWAFIVGVRLGFQFLTNIVRWWFSV